HALGVAVPEIGGDQRAPVGSMCRESPITELLHQLHPEPRRAPENHAGLAQPRGESRAGQRWPPPTPRLPPVNPPRPPGPRPPAMGTRIAQRPDHFAVFPERPRPPVREDQRLGTRALVTHLATHLAAHVNEVNRHAVDLGAELRIRVHRTFLLPPVVAIDPV